MDIRDEINNRLATQRTRLRNSFGMDEHRIAILQLLRTIDYQTVAEALSAPVDDADPDDHGEPFTQLFKWGLNESIALLWNHQMSLPGVPLVPTFPVLKEWASAILQCSGRLRLVEFGMEMARVNLATVGKHPTNPHSYIFEYAPKAIGIESIERGDLSIFEKLIKGFQERDGIWTDLKERKAKVLEMMKGLVNPWNTHYIQYGADPFIDDYYHDLSCAAAPHKLGWDAFPHETKFGGISFLKYINCVRCLMGFALKHLDFCLLLSKEHRAIDLINILTIPSEWDKSCEYIATALDIPFAEAEQTLRATTLSEENLSECTKIPAAPFALHYKIAGGSIARLITGCLDEPFLFLLRELRRRYPADWDRSVDDREQVFRRELAALLIKIPGVVVFSENVNISSSKGKTDIDLLAVDVVGGVAGVFQLKWQDHFGASIRERESRKSNLLKNGNLWIDRVCSWIEEGLIAQTLASLGLPKQVVSKIRSTRIFVLGRNFSHFSGEFEIDCRAAWGTWAQILRLSESLFDRHPSLTTLFDEIVADSPFGKGIRPQESQVLRFDDWEWVIQPCQSWDQETSYP